MNELIISLGVYDDWQWEKERINWAVWIVETLKTTRFKLYSRPGLKGDEAVLFFEDDRLYSLFALIAPELPPIYSQSEIERIVPGTNVNMMQAFRG